MGDRTNKLFAGVFGATYLAVGIVGFALTGFTDFAANGHHALLIFEVNPFHNFVHVGIGALWLGFALPAVPGEVTRHFSIGVGVVYLLATVLGFAGVLTALSIDAGAAPDNFLHAATAAAVFAVTRPVEFFRAPIPSR